MPIPVDSSIACIIARELLEGLMFIVSYFGAVESCPHLSSDEKFSYKRYLCIGLACGCLGGLFISLIIGFSIAKAVESIEEVEKGLEAGEATSKLIAAFFVVALSIKLPQWFGISAYRKLEKVMIPGLESAAVVDYDTEKAEKNAVGAEEIVEVGSSIDSKWSMGTSLFWNSLRECTEGGVLCAVVVIVSETSNDSLGASIGVGIGSAIGLAIIMAFGAKYISAKGFGIAATVIATCLAVGLITGATRSYEEVYAEHHDNQHTAFVYSHEEGDENGHALSAFEFIGIGGELTELVLAVWVTSACLLCVAQYWHNYLGYPLVAELNCLQDINNKPKAVRIENVNPEVI